MSGMSLTPLASVSRLNIAFGAGAACTSVVHDVSFDLQAGSILALVGESGSGKSVTARALLGLVGEGSHVTADKLEIAGVSVLGDGEAQWRARRGQEVGLVLQDALVSLDPLRPVGSEIREVLDVHDLGSRSARQARVIEALIAAGVPEPERRAQQRSGQLSGGLRQRALIAAAVAGNPRILIADEPTTALDSTVQQQILILLRSLAARGDAVLLITHDIAVVSEIADTVAVMKDGRVVEHGKTAVVLGNPQHIYTRSMLAALPFGKPKGSRLSADNRPSAANGLRERFGTVRQESLPDNRDAVVVEHISKRYRGSAGDWHTVVDDVSFRVDAGKTLGIVGESGAGKSTIARILLGFLEPDAGSVTLLGKRWSGLSERERRPLRSSLQMIYQDPLSSFDPRLDVERILKGALQAIGVTDKTAVHRRSLQLLDFVGLQEKHLAASPLTLSGGQRQRVSIARALAPEPAILLCDEPVSALDALTQAQVLDLLIDIQNELGLTYVFISHDLGVVHHVSYDILVLKAGHVVEHGPAQTIYAAPSHPYTQLLFECVPHPIARAS